MNSQRVKVIAAAAGAGAIIAGAAGAIGVAAADTHDVQPLNYEPAETSETVEGPTPAPEAGPSIDSPSTTPTTTEIPAPN